MDFEIENTIYSILRDESPDKSEFLVNGKSVEVDHYEIKGNKVLLIIEGKTFEVALNKSKNKISACLGLKAISASMHDDKDIKKIIKKNSSFGAKTVSSIMPGKVVKVFSKIGDEIKKGETVMIVEAMKMENELKSPCSGKIKSVNAKIGDSIEANAALMVIE